MFTQRRMQDLSLDMGGLAWLEELLHHIAVVELCCSNDCFGSPSTTKQLNKIES